MITETQHKKNHFNIIDFVLILAVVACIAGITLRKNLVSELKNTDDTAEVEVLISGILNDFVDQFVIGDEFYNPWTKDTFGTLVSFTVKPARKLEYKRDGHVIVTSYENRSDIYATFRLTGNNSENGFLIDNKIFIGVNGAFDIESTHLLTNCTVLDINAVK